MKANAHSLIISNTNNAKAKREATLLLSYIRCDMYISLCIDVSLSLRQLCADRQGRPGKQGLAVILVPNVLLLSRAGCAGVGKQAGDCDSGTCEAPSSRV